MGLAASQVRFLELTARKSDIEFTGQNINQQRMVNAFSTETMIQNLYTESITNGDPSKIESIQTQIDQKHVIDRRLEIQLKNIDTEQKEVQTEIESVKKVIDKNIDMTFKTFA